MSTPEPPRDSTTYHHGDLRRTLLVAAVNLLEERGADALSLRELARRSGVSHNAPYRHFADRDALLDAMAADGFRELAARMRGVAVATPVERLAALGQTYVAAALERPGRFALMFRVTADPSTFPATATAAAALMATLRDAVAAIIGDTDDPVALTTAWAVVHGLASLLLQGHLRVPSTSAPPSLPQDVRALVAAVTTHVAASLAPLAGPGHRARGASS